MATVSNITLAGGVKASRFFSEPLQVRHSAVFEAFSCLSDALAEAAAAVERMEEPASWDPALELIYAADVQALAAAAHAADQVMGLKIVHASDRSLVAAAHFIRYALGCTSAVERAQFASTLTSAAPIFIAPAQGTTARQAAAMVHRAIDRLRVAFESMERAVEFKDELSY
ncbi:hypothetical protein GCM10010991_37610 [Gemmobacter aquaticus]|uniref:Uncharacterized protein n=2 Tax=Gemmobacter aquaticus TaxID=490185 RepID=A0A917YNS0_9RHOB|nr:hypothetical protein GCM10010991_37610 [Gemmobacter aquaticus]